MDPTSPATVTEDLLAGVAATGLPGSILERPRRPLPDEQVEQLVTAATGSGVGRGLVGLLREAVVSGALPATDAQQARVLHCHDEGMTRAAGVVDELGEILDDVPDPSRLDPAQQLVPREVLESLPLQREDRMRDPRPQAQCQVDGFDSR